MKHGYFGRKLGRNKDERRRLFMILTRSLIEQGRVRTTLAKAKAVQPMVEQLITKTKAATSGSLGAVEGVLADFGSFSKLRDMAKTRFSARTSGYTRIVKLGTRLGDAAEMVYLEFVDAAPVEEKTEQIKPKASAAAKASAVVEEAEVVKEKKFVKPVKKTKTTK